ncbi:hypothetical protein BC629DRAFT_1012370 [Irpex lacteus]|nr:hypothetical protein BC629DRAFT_1012370 [Irpex lacteus]
MSNHASQQYGIGTHRLSIVDSHPAAFSWTYQEIGTYIQQQYNYCLVRKDQRKVFEQACDAYNKIILPSLNPQNARHGGYIPDLDGQPRVAGGTAIQYTTAQEAADRTIAITDFYSALAFIINVTELNLQKNTERLRDPALCKELAMVFGKICHTMWSRYFSHPYPQNTQRGEVIAQPTHPAKAYIIYDMSSISAQLQTEQPTQLNTAATHATSSSGATSHQPAIASASDIMYPGTASFGSSLPGTTEYRDDGKRGRPVHSAGKDESSYIRYDTLGPAIHPQLLEQAPLVNQTTGKGQNYGHCAETNPFITHLHFCSPSGQEVISPSQKGGYAADVKRIGRCRDWAEANRTSSGIGTPACQNCQALVVNHNYTDFEYYDMASPQPQVYRGSLQR